MKLHKKEDKDFISPSELKCGQIAVTKNGAIVQRHKNTLITIGCGYSQTWDHIPDSILVRILPNTTLLEITNN